MKKVLFFLLVMLLTSGLSFGEGVDNKTEDVNEYENQILTLLNEPEIGGIAEFRIRAESFWNDKEMEITCEIPEGWEFINDQNYATENVFLVNQDGKKGIRVYFWKGYMEVGKVKEILFKARIPDGKKYMFSVYTNHDSELFELDLGQPDPPDLYKGSVGYGITQIYEFIEKPYPYYPERTEIVKKEFALSQGEIPPVSTELRKRTKHIPYISNIIYSDEVPLRYLVYTDIEAKKVTVTVNIPRKDLELVDEENYQVTKTDEQLNVTLYHGPMKAKESKAFYFKVRAISSKDKYDTKVEGETEVLTADGRKIYTSDLTDWYFHHN